MTTNLRASADPPARTCQPTPAQAKDDRRELLESDIHRAGVRRSKHEAVTKLASEGPDCVQEFLLRGSLAEVRHHAGHNPIGPHSDCEEVAYQPVCLHLRTDFDTLYVASHHT